MLVFTKVIEANSFSGAADALNMPRSSVTTTIQALEAHLKVRLINRTTRRISLTPDGAVFYERCSHILAEVEDTESALSVSTPARGKLKVEMPGSIGRHVVVSGLHDFHARYPDIDLMLGVSDKAVDLIQESVDCAIRIGPLRDSTLVARRVGMSEVVTVASPEYLRRNRALHVLADLDRHIAVNYLPSRNNRLVAMDFVVDGKPVEVSIRSKLAVNDGDTYLQCGLRGLGIIQVPHFLAFAHLQSGALVEVLARWRPMPLPVFAVFPRHRHVSPQVRAFIDWVTERFEQCALLRVPDAQPAEILNGAERVSKRLPAQRTLDATAV